MFQLKLNFSTENNILPIDMERYIVSFLKKSTELYSKKFYESLFNKSESHVKSYTFSLYLPEASFESDVIKMNANSFTLYFSDIDRKELFHFFNSFIGMKHKKFNIKDNSITLNSVDTVNMHEIENDEIIIKMYSPLLVRRHDKENNKDRYLSYDDDGFQDSIIGSIKHYIKCYNMDLDINHFSIVPVDSKIIITNVFGGKIKGNIGFYKLSGNKKLLNFLYASGIGSRRSEGFGKFEVMR